MKSIILTVLLIFISIYSGILSFYTFQQDSLSKEVIINVNESNIHREDIIKRLEKDYWATAVSNMTDELLIEAEASKNDILNPSKDQLMEEVILIETFQRNDTTSRK